MGIIGKNEILFFCWCFMLDDAWHSQTLVLVGVYFENALLLKCYPICYLIKKYANLGTLT
jgi:hypothetical protein